MIPELGRHAGPVLGAYGVTLVLLGGIVLASFLRAARVRAALTRLETAIGRRHDGRT